MLAARGQGPTPHDGPPTSDDRQPPVPRDGEVARLWTLIVAIVGLSLFVTLMAPSRTMLLAVLVLLLVPVAVLRRSLIVPALLIILPFYSLIRRFFLLREPSVLNLDPLILLPDLLTLLAAGHLAAAIVMGRNPFQWRQATSKDGRPPMPAADVVALVMLGITALGFVVGTRNGLVPALNGARMFAIYLVLYFFARAVLRRYRQVGEILVVTVFTGFITGLYGIYQTLVGLPAYDQIYLDNTPARVHIIGGFVRAFSTFQFTSHFSVFMLIAFISALTLFQLRPGRGLRLFCAATMLICLGAIGATFVRSTWVGLAGALAAYALFAWVRRPMLRWVVVLALVPALHLSYGFMVGDRSPAALPATESATQVLQSRAYSVLSARADTDLAGRYLGLQAAIRAAASGPLGYGLGSTSAERFGGGMVAWSGDSQITTLLAELGWPGLLCFFALLALTLRCNLKAVDAAPPGTHRTLLVGIAGIQVGLIVTSLTGGPLWYTQPTCVYGWLLAGIAVNAGTSLAPSS